MGHDSTADGNPKSDEKMGSSNDGSKVSATSMFAAIPAADAPIAPTVGSSTVLVRSEPSSVSPPSPPPGMPVVHEVVFPSPGSGPSDGSASILSTLRSLASDEKVRAAELPPSSCVRNELPTAKPNAGTSFVQSPPSAGFTQLLHALGETPAATAVSPSPPPAPQTDSSPAPTPSSAASFTRLLHALDADRGTPSTPRVEAVPPPERESAGNSGPTSLPAAESATLLMQRLPEVTDMPEGSTVEPVASQFPHIGQSPAGELKAKPSAPQSAGSFTELFQALDPESSDQHIHVPEMSPAVAPAPPWDAAKSPGSFTQLFQAIDSGISRASSPAAPAVTIPPASSTPVASASPSGDSLKRMFQSIDPGNTSALAPVIPGTPAGETTVSPETQSAGSFTQLFQAIDPGASSVPLVVAPKSASSLPVASAAPSGGSFTELFRAIDPSVGTSTPAAASRDLPSNMAAAPGSEVQPPSSFTQMFRGVDGGAGTPSDGASRSTQSWGHTPPPEGEPAAPPPRTVSPLVTDPRSSDGSNLTQLLRTLDQSGPSPGCPNPPPIQPPGAFTSIYGERQAVGNPVEQAQPVPAAPNFSQPPRTDIATPGRSISPEPVSIGSSSSDFTRIIQASSLREQALKRGEQLIEAPQQAVLASPPAAQPKMPNFPAAAPQFPHPNLLPPLNFGHGNATPPVQPFRGMPSLNPAQWMPPEPPLSPAPASRTQPLLPLVLIGIIFALVVVLVAVVFLLKH